MKKLLLAVCVLLISLPGLAAPHKKKMLHPSVVSQHYPAGTRLTGRLIETFVPADAQPGQKTYIHAILAEADSPNRDVYVYCRATLAGEMQGDRFVAAIHSLSCDKPEPTSSKVDAVVLDGYDNTEGLKLEVRQGKSQIPWGRPVTVILNKALS